MPEEKSSKFKPFSNETLASLDAAHGDIRVVRGVTPKPKPWQPNVTPEPPWEAVFRAPTTGESDNFEGAAHNEKARTGALRNLAKATVVGVSHGGVQTVCMDRKDAESVRKVRDAWDSLRGEFPGAHLAAQDDMLELSGQTKEEAGKE